MILNDSLLEEEKQTIEVGPINSPDQAKDLAKAWLAKNPGFEWRGQWKTPTPGKISVIEVYKVPIVDLDNISPFQKTLFSNLTKALSQIKERIDQYLKNLP